MYRSRIESQRARLSPTGKPRFPARSMRTRPPLTRAPRTRARGVRVRPRPPTNRAQERWADKGYVLRTVLDFGPALQVPAAVRTKRPSPSARQSSLAGSLLTHKVCAIVGHPACTLRHGARGVLFGRETGEEEG